jgi:D-glycero-alpha-D-manno-heptose-7-phosphate kinase
VPPYSDEMGGYVCNLAITRYATVTVTRGGQREPDAESRGSDKSITDAAARRFHMNDASISVRSDFPIGAGLGGSSATGVAAVAALAMARGESMLPSAIAELSRSIEVGDLGIAGGRQDHYAAAFGGALGLRFSARGTEVRNIPLGAKIRSDIERRCFIVYTGQSRVSGETITAVMDAYRNRDPVVLFALQRIRALAESMADALAAGDLETLAKLVTEQWTHQRSLNPAIPTPRIDEIVEKAAEAGSIGAKALGASGGGCVLVIARNDRIDQVREVVEPLGEILPFTIAPHGVDQCA